MSSREVYRVRVEVGDQVLVHVAHEGRNVWCRVDKMAPGTGPGRWLDVTPVDPADANVAAFTLGQVLKARRREQRGESLDPDEMECGEHGDLGDGEAWIDGEGLWWCIHCMHWVEVDVDVV